MSNPIERKKIWIEAICNTFKQSDIDIEKTLKYLDSYEIDKALRIAVSDKKLKRKLERRQEKLNSHFVWTPEKVEKLRSFNNKMWFRYKEAYDEVCRLKKEFDTRFANGDKNYASYDIRTEFWYNCENGLPKQEEKLWEDLCEESVFWEPEFAVITDRTPLKSFEEEMLEDGHSWNEYPFNCPELVGICIHYFMHDIFNHNHTYSLEDLMNMKPENFSWQVNISLEHWGKSVER